MDIESSAPYIEVLTTTAQLHLLVRLGKWLSVRLPTKSLWVEVSLQSLKIRFRACFEQGVP